MFDFDQVKKLWYLGTEVVVVSAWTAASMYIMSKSEQ